jgi:hypothetical protein
MTQLQKSAIDPIDEVADEIAALSEGVQRLLTGKLSDRAVVTLIHDALPSAAYGGSKIANRTQIKEVLAAAANLKNLYIKKLKGKANHE